MDKEEIKSYKEGFYIYQGHLAYLTKEEDKIFLNLLFRIKDSSLYRILMIDEHGATQKGLESHSLDQINPKEYLSSLDRFIKHFSENLQSPPKLTNPTEEYGCPCFKKEEKESPEYPRGYATYEAKMDEKP